jgi:hypothetical protein
MSIDERVAQFAEDRARVKAEEQQKIAEEELKDIEFLEQERHREERDREREAQYRLDNERRRQDAFNDAAERQARDEERVRAAEQFMRDNPNHPTR